MTDTPAPTITPDVLEFMKAWATNFAQVMEQITGAAFPVELALEPFAQELRTRKTELQLTIVTGGAVHGEMVFSLPRAICAELAAIFIGEKVEAEAELTSENQEAVLELFRQVAGQTAGAVKSRWGEVQITAQWGGVPTWTAAGTALLKTSSGETTKFLAELQVSSALAAELRAKPLNDGMPVKASVDEVPPRLDRLMDVELQVSLRFGGKRMVLREILELGPAAVVELDRQVQEPIELLLDGRVLARGEVVVVDGNYGLKVTEVVSER
jgi:flagellar motor switch protein FliN